MNQPIRTCLAVLASAGAFIWPAAVNASEVASSDLTAAHVRAAFVGGGYAVGEPSQWDAGVTSLSVHDAAGARPGWPLVRVFIFADADAAASAHREAHARDQAWQVPPVALSIDRGPRLLVGYGASTWRHNIALVQTAAPWDAGAFPAEPDCAPTPVVTATTAADLSALLNPQPASGVDRKFLDLLEGAQTAL